MTITKWLFPLLLATSGCFSSWAITQAAGGQRILDEGTREERVPMPDVRERLHVTMPLAPQFRRVDAPATGATTDARLTVADEPQPFALECRSTQTASDTVYRSGFRYGSTWKKVTAVMFAIEAGLAAAYYFGSDRDKPGNQLATGVLAADALGTAALFFVPRKERYGRDVEPVYSQIRSDCPAGLILEVAGETFPVDAAGRIGEVGEAALDGWMRAPSPAPVRLTFQDRVIDLRLGHNEVCTWNRLRHQDQSTCPAYWSSGAAIAATLEVPMGTLTQPE